MDNKRELNAYALIHEWRRVVERALDVIEGYEVAVAGHGPFLAEGDAIAILLEQDELRSFKSMVEGWRRSMTEARDVQSDRAAARSVGMAALVMLEVPHVLFDLLSGPARSDIESMHPDIAEKIGDMKAYMANVRVAYHVAGPMRSGR